MLDCNIWAGKSVSLFHIIDLYNKFFGINMGGWKGWGVGVIGDREGIKCGRYYWK
jgi:hypothetical protein